jgi:membrane protein DedA with SNARE-associated domain
VSLTLALVSGGVLQYLIGWFENFHYLAPFIVLLLCGLGAPLPEEVTLIGCGFLLSQHRVDFLVITLVCTAAILLGDSLPYWLGRLYGLSALKTRWVAKVLHPERFAKLERRFAENGNWAIFTCRFLPGLRIPGYFTAGTLRMSFTRFLVIDSLGVALSVPTSIWVSKLVFDKIGFDPDKASQKVAEFNHLLWAGLAIVLLSLFLWRWFKNRRKKAEASADAAASVSEPAAVRGLNLGHLRVTDAPATVQSPSKRALPPSGESG